MVLEGTTEESEGVFVSRWAATLDRDPKNTKAFVMLASLSHGVYTDKNDSSITNEWFRIKMLYPQPPKIVTNQTELEDALAESLSKKARGSNPEAIVRITDDEGEREIISVFPKRVEIEEDGSKFKTVVEDSRESVENFKTEQEAKFDMICAFLGDPDIKIEVISATVLYPGSATKEKLETQHESSKEISCRKFLCKKRWSSSRRRTCTNLHNLINLHNLMKRQMARKKQKARKKNKPNQRFPEIGYHFCVVGTRSYADGTPYLTYIKPLFEYSEATSVKDIEIIFS